MSTGDGYGHRWGRNGEFRLTVGPTCYLFKALAVIRTDHLADLGCMLAQLGLTLACSKRLKGDELPCDGPRSMRKSSSIKLLY